MIQLVKFSPSLNALTQPMDKNGVDDKNPRARRTFSCLNNAEMSLCLPRRRSEEEDGGRSYPARVLLAIHWSVSSFTECVRACSSCANQFARTALVARLPGDSQTLSPIPALDLEGDARSRPLYYSARWIVHRTLDWVHFARLNRKASKRWIYRHYNDRLHRKSA